MSGPQIPFPRIDTSDPLARLLAGKLGLDWPQVWLVALLYFGIVEKLMAAAVGGFDSFQFGVDIRKWKPDLEAMLVGFVEFPIFFAYYLWSGRGVPEIFENLARNGCFSDAQRYRAFMARAWRSMTRRWWSLLSLGLAMSAMYYWQFHMWNRSKPDVIEPWFGWENPYNRYAAIVGIGVVAYIIGQIVLREALTIFWLRRLWRELGSALVVTVYHPDGAGGLGALGRHAVRLSVFLMTMLLFIVMGAILPYLRDPKAVLDTVLAPWNPVLTVGWVVYLIALVGSFAILFLPAHRAMSVVRDVDLNRLRATLKATLESARHAAVSERAELPALLKKLEDVKKLVDLIEQDYPVWPIRGNRVERFKLTLLSVFPLVNFAITTAVGKIVGSVVTKGAGTG